MTLSRPAFRQISPPLDVTDEQLAKVSEIRGVPEMVSAGKETPPPTPSLSQDRPIGDAGTPPLAKSPTSKKTALASKRTPTTAKISVEVPGYVSDAVNLRAAQEKSTARHLVLRGLQAIGFAIEEADLVRDARRSARTRRT